jgi:L-pipecolate oxidase
MTTNPPISLWDVSAAEPEIATPFDAEGRVDVAIVGGGFTGLSTALHAAAKGLSAHVIEAEQIGFGGSGRNVGLVNAGVWLPPQKVRAMLGDKYGPRFLRTFSDGPATVFNLIEKHQIRCEVTRSGTIHAAHAASGLRDLSARHAEWQRMGEPVDLLTRQQMADMIGTDRFVGGLLDHRAGTINPMGYCRGLARAALGAGARITTGARATALHRDPDGWRVETDRGTLTAKSVVLGTNAYTDNLWPGLARIFSIIHYFQVATRPLGTQAAHILPGRQGVWDTAPVMSSYRRDAANRLLIGSMGRVSGSAAAGLTRRFAQKQIARYFPALGEVEFEDAWHGQIAMTPDHLPRVIALDTGLYTAIGYNGRGITTGTIFGAAMADLLTGMDPEDLPMPMSHVSKVSAGALKSRALDLAFTANQLWKALL